MRIPVHNTLIAAASPHNTPAVGPQNTYSAFFSLEVLFFTYPFLPPEIPIDFFFFQHPNGYPSSNALSALKSRHQFPRLWHSTLYLLLGTVSKRLLPRPSQVWNPGAVEDGTVGAEEGAEMAFLILEAMRRGDRGAPAPEVQCYREVVTACGR